MSASSSSLSEGVTSLNDAAPAAMAAEADVEEDIRPSPACFRRHCLGDGRLAWLLLATGAALSVVSLALQAVAEVQQDTAS